jgi:hypothetical protein
LVFKWTLSFGLYHHNPAHFPFLSHACHLSLPSNSTSVDLPNNTWGWVENMKHLIMQLPPFSCYSIPLWVQITLFSDTVSPCSFLTVRDQVSRSYKKKTGRIMVLYISTFIFLDNRRQNTLDRMLQAFIKFSLFLISSCMTFWYIWTSKNLFLIIMLYICLAFLQCDINMILVFSRFT